MNFFLIYCLILVYATRTIQGERCPDRTICPTESSTCCPAREGSGFNCCPLSQAVCCEGGLYCCPSGSTCNSKNGTCEDGRGWRETGSGSISASTADDSIASENQVCPDKEHECSSDATCCQISEHDYGCCPYTQAVCCSDNQHCCPHGSVCNVSTQTCDKLMTRVTSTGMWHNVSTTVCPGGKFQCSDGSTCCNLGGDVYGCCPLQDAVCCPDRVNCCPSGFSCSDGGCLKSGNHHKDMMTLRTTQQTTGRK